MKTLQVKKEISQRNRSLLLLFIDIFLCFFIFIIGFTYIGCSNYMIDCTSSYEDFWQVFTEKGFEDKEVSLNSYLIGNFVIISSVFKFLNNFILGSRLVLGDVKPRFIFLSVMGIFTSTVLFCFSFYPIIKYGMLIFWNILLLSICLVSFAITLAQFIINIYIYKQYDKFIDPFRVLEDKKYQAIREDAKVKRSQEENNVPPQ